jgi:cytochrome c553
MRRIFITAALLASTALAPVAILAAAPLELKSVSVDLPDSDTMFQGPGSDAVNNNCLSCHSADMVLNQPHLPKETWEAEVHKMIDKYKAPVDQADVGAIVDYLSKLQPGP